MGYRTMCTADYNRSSDENRWNSGERAFALDRVENFRNLHWKIV